jgi:UDP-glucuronate decarboxylase
MMDSPPSFTGPVNLGNPEEFTILELAEAVIDLTGSRSKIVRHPLPIDDPKRRCPDISLARETLSWAPRVRLKEGLTKTTAFLERELSLANAARAGLEGLPLSRGTN